MTVEADHLLFADEIRLEQPVDQAHERQPDEFGVIPDPAMMVIYQGVCAFFAPNTTGDVREINSRRVSDETRVDIVMPSTVSMPGPTVVATIVRWSRHPQLQGEQLDIEPGPLMTHDVVTEVTGILRRRSS